MTHVRLVATFGSPDANTSLLVFYYDCVRYKLIRHALKCIRPHKCQICKQKKTIFCFLCIFTPNITPIKLNKLYIKEMLWLCATSSCHVVLRFSKCVCGAPGVYVMCSVWWWVTLCLRASTTRSRSPCRLSSCL